MNKELNVVVVYGGISTEREVSLKSGKAVYDALKRYGYSNVSLFDFVGTNISELINNKPDIAYLALHGRGGEDGCIQGALELAGIPYTGPGVSCSAVCMNKVLTKHVLSSASIPTAKFLEFWKSNCSDIDSIINEIELRLGIPVVLKSPNQGSSIGVYIIKNKSEMRDAIISVFELGDQLLAEEFIEGIEVTLPIIGNDDLIVLPEIEITSERDFYDYQAKYTQGLCHHIIPARIEETDRMKLQEIGKRVYRELDCRGISRIDFIIDKNQGPVVIEINTLPGMTATSLVPDSARAKGISFEELTSHILEFGLDEHTK